MEKYDFLTKVDRTIPIGFSRACFLSDNPEHPASICSCYLPGDYLLFDNRYSASTAFRQEIGIILGSNDLYLDLENMPFPRLTAAEALAYCKAVRETVPSTEEVKLLMENYQVINRSLECIGRKDYKLAGTVSQFWSKESVNNAGKYETRRVVFIKKAQDIKNDGHPYVTGFFNFSEGPRYEGFVLVHKDYGDPYWILQVVGGNIYHILESRLRCFLYAPQDRSCNGSIHDENGSLVVENPTGETFYRNEQRYAVTDKDYYQKDGYGIYRKIGYNRGEWIAPLRDPFNE